MKSAIRYFCFLALFIILIATWFVWTLPNAKQIEGCLTTRMYKVYLCEQSNNFVKLKNISPTLRNLILIAEDVGFYSHHGFDLDELSKSLEKNWSEFRFARGGSTITQQLAKNVFLPFDKSLLRKIREAVLAHQVEELLSKDKIFEKYLNVIEFGPHIFGVKSASQFYFSKSPDQLNLLESAFLTYLIPNPKLYSQVVRKGSLTKFARFRILDLCYKMYRYGRITQAQYDVAKAYVDDFPWQGIGLDQKFNGPEGDTTIITSDTIIPAERTNLPDHDQSLEYIEPPPETETEAQSTIEPAPQAEIIEPEGQTPPNSNSAPPEIEKSKNEDHPFDP